MAWLTGWRYRKSHTINGSTAGAQTDYQIKITIHYGSGTDSGEDVYLNEHCRTDFGDVRFTSDDEITEIPYWMEEKVDGDYAVFWVKVPSIPASPNTTTIYIYYGNPSATTTSSLVDTMELLEIGKLSWAQSDRATWYSQNFQYTMKDPIVIMLNDMTNAGSEEFSIRLRNITSEGFEYQLRECSNRDGAHTTETFGYIAITSRGLFKFTDGRILVADKFDSSANLHAEAVTIDTSETRSFGYTFTNPVVFPAIQTFNDPSNGAKVRIKSVTTTDFTFGMEDEGNDTTAHGTETIGYIAIEIGTGTIIGVPYEIEKTPNVVTNALYTVNFTQTFGVAPDSSITRTANVSTTSFQTYIDEDTTYDSETTHTDEVVAYFAIEQTGVYPLAKYVSPEPSHGAWGSEETTTFTFIQEVSDVGKVAEALKKASLKVYKDTGKSTDYLTKDSGRTFTEIVISYDYMAKTPSKTILDRVFGEHMPSTFFGKWFIDTVGSVDYICRDVEKVVEDVGASADYLRRGILKSFVDVGVVSDWYSKLVAKALVDAGISYDYLVKDSLKSVADVGAVTDWYSKDIAIVFVDASAVSELVAKDVLRIFRDWAFGEYAPAVLTAKEFREALTVSDYICRDLVKAFVEFVVARDAPYRTITLVLRDRVFQEYWTSRGISPAMRDISKMKDVITKVAYKIAGLDVRRVYALPREWADIIEDTDHNIKIDVCNALLEAMKRVRDKLEA